MINVTIDDDTTYFVSGDGSTAKVFIEAGKRLIKIEGTEANLKKLAYIILHHIDGSCPDCEK